MSDRKTRSAGTSSQQPSSEGDEDLQHEKTETNKKRQEEQTQKSIFGDLGGLPSSMEDIAHVTSVAESGPARSVGAIAAHSMGGFGPLTSIPPPSLSRGVDVGPPRSMMRHSDPFLGSKPSPFASQDAKAKSAGPLRARSAPSSAAASSARRWSVTDESLPTLPPFHPLERTSVFVPHASASEVARKIEEVLRSRSIATKFDDRKAKAKCLTSDNVDFRVRLYRGRNQFSHGVIAEVQRRFGFSVNYNSDVVAILDGAEGKTVTCPSSTSSQRALQCITEMKMEPNQRVLSSLSVVADLLEEPSQNMDSAMLGLDSLLSMTDPSKMGNQAALRASRQIMMLESVAGSTIRKTIADILLNLGPLGSTGEEEDLVFSLRTRSMSVLSHVLSNLANAGEGDLIRNQTSFFVNEIVPMILSELRSASDEASMADASARALYFLLITLGGTDRSLEQAVLEGGGYDALCLAKDVGYSSHASLAKYTGLCLDILD